MLSPRRWPWEYDLLRRREPRERDLLCRRMPMEPNLLCPLLLLQQSGLLPDEELGKGDQHDGDAEDATVGTGQRAKHGDGQTTG